jgi:hypothetical protein
MVAQLPAIQQEDACLSRAREARALRKAAESAALLETEIEHYQQTIDKALVDARAASDRQDKDEEGSSLALLRMYTELRYTRLAAMERSRDKLRDLLRQGTLTLDDPLDDYALSDGEYGGLASRIQDFQEEYQHLYALCRHLEGLE